MNSRPIYFLHNGRNRRTVIETPGVGVWVNSGGGVIGVKIISTGCSFGLLLLHFY